MSNNVTITVSHCTRLVPPLADLVEGPQSVLNATVSLGLDVLVAARPPRSVFGHLVPRITLDGFLDLLPLHLLFGVL